MVKEVYGFHAAPFSSQLSPTFCPLYFWWEKSKAGVDPQEDGRHLGQLTPNLKQNEFCKLSSALSFISDGIGDA